jgi:septal ring factor EnvC (AmiA/AmiB activator)
MQRVQPIASPSPFEILNICHCCRELSDRERQKNHLTGESAELRKNIESISNEIRRKQSQKSSAERTLRETERDFTELSRGDSNRLSLYGDASLTQVHTPCTLLVDFFHILSLPSVSLPDASS